MKSIYRAICLCLVFVTLLILLRIYDIRARPSTTFSKSTPVFEKRIQEDVVICVVACGDRLEESLTMMKSALIFSKRSLRFIVISDNNLIQAFTEKLSDWKEFYNKTFEFVVRPVEFPVGDNVMWRKLFKPCAAQRLFLPTLLNDTDSVLYMDTDTLFLSPPELIWDEFRNMNSSQLAALSPEHEDPNVGWYNRFAKHPFYGKLGVNSGVMLMNLTRMRNFRWTEYVVPIFKEYQLKITWGDQDIINIIFHYHPERLYVYSCRYNYRPDHCMYMSVCNEVEKKGAFVLHGSRGMFHSQRQPSFKAAFTAIQEYQLNTDPYENFLLPMKNYLSLEDSSNCGKVLGAFLVQPELHISAPL